MDFELVALCNDFERIEALSEAPMETTYTHACGWSGHLAEGKCPKCGEPGPWAQSEEPMDANHLLTREDFAALLGSEMVARGADVITIDKSRLEQLREEMSVTVQEREHCYIITVDDSERDTDAPPEPAPSDQFPKLGEWP